MLAFEWDAKKSRENLRKHGVPFEEARMVFFDDFAVEFLDELHSIGEDRYLVLGKSDRGRLLLVSYCERREGEIMRIISARKATASERKLYRGPVL